MPTYIVNVREIWVQPIKIIAQDKGEAIAKVQDGEGEYLHDQLEYCDTRSPIEWTVSEEK